MNGNLFLVDRIDCEDEDPRDTPLARLVLPIRKLRDRGFAMPTLLLRCAGKREKAVLDNPVLMNAARELHAAGAPVGLHVHSGCDRSGGKMFSQYNDPKAMTALIRRAQGRFAQVFQRDPEFFGMGDLACSNAFVASILSTIGIRMDISDVVTNRRFRVHGEVIFDYSSGGWSFELPSCRYGVWWVPHGTDRSPGEFLDLRNRLGLLMGQGEEEFARVFATYARIGESHPNEPVIIASIVHPPETLDRWAAWVRMHEIAAASGFANIDAYQALNMLDSAATGRTAGRQGAPP